MKRHAEQGWIRGRDRSIAKNLNPLNQKILGLTLQTQAYGFDLGQFGHVEVSRGDDGSAAVQDWLDQAFSSSLSAKLLVLIPPSEPLMPL